MKYKDLINVAAECEWYIAFHCQAAAGATREELMEAVSTAVLMHEVLALAHLESLKNTVN